MQNTKDSIRACNALSNPLELEVADTHDTPVIISYPSLPIDKFKRFGAWTRSALQLCERAKVPVCLHLDHGKLAKACLTARLPLSHLSLQPGNGLSDADQDSCHPARP